MLAWTVWQGKQQQEKKFIVQYIGWKGDNYISWNNRGETVILESANLVLSNCFFCWPKHFFFGMIHNLQQVFSWYGSQVWIITGSYCEETWCVVDSPLAKKKKSLTLKTGSSFFGFFLYLSWIVSLCFLYLLLLQSLHMKPCTILPNK